MYTKYVDSARDEWTLKIVPVLKKSRLTDLIAETGMSKRALQDVRAGRSRRHAKNWELLIRALLKLVLI